MSRAKSALVYNRPGTGIFERQDESIMQTRYCRRHPRAKAGWHCSTCATDLCPDCVATHELGHRQAPMDLCCQCRRGVAPLTIHRSQQIPFWQRLLDAPKYPLCTVGLLSLVGLGFVRALTGSVGMMSMMAMGTAVFLLRQGLYWAFVFFIIRNSAEGARKMGVFGLRDIQNDVITPGLKGILSTALLWLPAAIYIMVVSDDGVWGILSYEGSKDPIVWLLGLMGIVYAPMALLAGATDLGYGTLLNPVHIFSFIRRMGRDYFVTIVAIAVVLLFGRMLEYLCALALARTSIPFLPRWLTETVSLYPTFVAARALGVLLFTRGEALDWGRTEDYQVPLLPGVRPRGTLKEKLPVQKRALPDAPVPAPATGEIEPASMPVFDPQVGPPSTAPSEPRIELASRPGPPPLEIEPAQIVALPSLPSRPAPMPMDVQAFEEASPPPVDVPITIMPQPTPVHPEDKVSYPTVRGFSPNAGASAPPPSQPRLDLGFTVIGRAEAQAGLAGNREPSRDEPNALLLRAVDESRMDEALRLYRGLPAQDPTIPARVHMAIGREASRKRDFDMAITAFEQVAFTANEQAGAALVALAQIHGDGYRDPATAEKLYRETIKRFPSSDVAAFAERKLAALKTGP